jgi:putative transposase
MARLARLVIPGLPHHVTQRGNRRQETFLNDGDYAACLELMAEWCGEEGVEIWAYCLTPNHVHLIAVPKNENGLRRAIGEARRRYTLGGARPDGNPTCRRRALFRVAERAPQELTTDN